MCLYETLDFHEDFAKLKMLRVLVHLLKHKFHVNRKLWLILTFSRYISHTLSCLSLFFIHMTLRIFSRVNKSVKATYMFSHKIKLTYLTASKSEKQTIFLV